MAKRASRSVQTCGTLEKTGLQARRRMREGNIPRPGTASLEKTLTQWKGMLKGNLPEADYQTFLSEHAGLFLARLPHHAVVVSKLKLGSDYETDFVVVSDDYSMGQKYTLIEIEVPGVALFNRDGSLSKRLNAAITQIRSWKRWIGTHKSCVRDILPSAHNMRGGQYNIRFMLIIGRRHTRRDGTPDDENIQRAWLGTETPDLTIRSFDFLTSIAEDRLRQHYWALLGERCLPDIIPHHVQSELGLVDWPALTHSEWHDYVRSRDFSCVHLIAHNWPSILELRRKRRGSMYKPLL